jgi:hypothetical protein
MAGFNGCPRDAEKLPTAKPSPPPLGWTHDLDAANVKAGCALAWSQQRRTGSRGQHIGN